MIEQETDHKEPRTKNQPLGTILVTGGAGFIGTNFIRCYLAKHSDCSIVNLDKLTYAGNLENLRDVEADSRYRFVKGDVADRELVSQLFEKEDFDGVVNFAAESHVDRSILDATPFIVTNIGGTQTLLDIACRHWKGASQPRRFVQVSTDEVYGELGETGRFTEESPLAPNSPYSASKASADLLCRAYFKTHGCPVVITRSSNNYGPYQFPEKLIPLMIVKAARNEKLPVYGDGTNVRDWIHVIDHCRAIDHVLQKGIPGEVYNIGGGYEKRNIDIVRLILDRLGKPETLIEYVKDRPGHDYRYALDASKINREMGWSAEYSFKSGIEETVQWYQRNERWVARCLTGEYRSYYAANYHWREAERE